MKATYVAGLNKSNQKKQKASIEKGRKASKEGKKLDKSYYRKRQMIGKAVKGKK
jgi:hypothetical protein